MAKSKNKPQVKSRPALSPETRENQLIALAVDLAEKQLREGTASSQVISHFLKLGSTVANLEKERLKNEVTLMKAKTESIKAAKNIESLYKEAINAMRSYGGHDND